MRQTVPSLGGPVVPDGGRVCTKSGEKCAGAPGQPAVVFAPCCDNRLVCGVPRVVDASLWGQFCTTVAAVDTAATQAANGLDATVAASTSAAPAAATTTAAPPDATTAVVVVASTAADDDATTTAAADATTTGTDETTTDTATTTTATTTTETTTTPTDDADPEESDEDDESACFPAAATVELQTGAVVRMDALSIGDTVKVGAGEYSRVFMFTHKTAGARHAFVTLTTASGAALALTRGHYLYANGALVAAAAVRVGDVLALGDGRASPVVQVGSAPGGGLYNPQTVHGDVVVDGVLASTYTTAVEPRLAHAALAPLRVLDWFGLSCTALEDGGGKLADLAPRGHPAF